MQLENSSAENQSKFKPITQSKKDLFSLIYNSVQNEPVYKKIEQHHINLRKQKTKLFFEQKRKRSLVEQNHQVESYMCDD